jgi:hypothetical protein
MTVVLDTTIRPEVLRGRGALSNAVGRYEKQTRVLLDDGWDDGWRSEDDAPPPIKTEVIHRLPPAASSPATNRRTSASISRSIPYRRLRAWLHLLLRPAHARLSGHVAGGGFRKPAFRQAQCRELLAKELSAPGYVPKVIAMGTNTDPYQPLEKKMRITRQILEVLARLPATRRHRHQVAADPARHRHPVGHGEDGLGQGGAVVHHHLGPQGWRG